MPEIHFLFIIIKYCNSLKYKKLKMHENGIEVEREDIDQIIPEIGIRS
jgi:hypothetical protein